jgi:hypothetical protein
LIQFFAEIVEFLIAFCDCHDVSLEKKKEE